ncbi:MAG: hypothetical protein HW378_3767, partial [Anaerolineales bacterium]|nr:hypothetical protein [Anaerolineales bacterium]
MDTQPIRPESPEPSPEPSGIHIGASGDVVIGGDVAGRDLIKNYYQIVISPDDQEPPAPGDPPYKGLQYFDEHDADHFFGRERLTAKIVSRLPQTRFLTIIGASGSGKSSLIRAGVIPALRRGQSLADGSLPPTGSGQWDIRTLTPTAHPLEALAATLARHEESVTAMTALQQDLAAEPRALALAAQRLLARNGKRHLLLFIDQFEELFTLCRQPAERETFINNLLAAVAPEAQQPVTVLAALRADFYAQCSQHAGLREWVSQQQEYIGAMSRDELLSAILQPAALGNWKIQEGLVELMLDEAGGEPGALPLLSHALLETWSRRRGRKLTLSGYQESGGIQGAIAKTAETVFQQRLAPAQRPIARMIFLQLTELGASENSPDTRRRVPFSELITRATDAPTLEAVLNILADARLITTGTLPPGDAKVVEVAHEAIIREWPTLRHWLNENREGLLRQRQLTEDANDWEKLGRDAGALYRGARLRQNLEWAERFPEPLTVLETEFLQASRENVEREAAEAKRLAQATQKQRVLAAIAAISVLVMVVAGVVWGIAPALRTPGTMDGIFNVAIAEFAEIGGDGKVADTSTAGHLLSQWTSEQLQADFDQNAPELKAVLWRDNADLRREKNVRLGVVADDPPAGSEAPATLAHRVKADVVVYGVITPRPNGFAELQIKLYVAQPLDRDFGAMTGQYALGIPLLFKRDDPGAEVQETLKRQVRGMGQVMLAVAYGRSNQSLETIDALKKAQESLGDSDVIAYLLGQEYLFFAQQGSADREQNISLNPAYARASIGLGSVFFTQAQDTLAATYSDQSSNSKEDAYRTVLDQIEPAIQNYQRAVEQSGSGAPDDDFLAATARIGLGTSYRIKGEALYRLGDSAGAQQWIAEAVNTLETATQSLTGVQDYRVRAQAYQGLGTAYEWQAFLNGNAPAMLQQALSAYNQCIEQGDLSPLDTFLKDEIIA